MATELSEIAQTISNGAGSVSALCQHDSLDDHPPVRVAMPAMGVRASSSRPVVDAIRILPAAYDD